MQITTGKVVNITRMNNSFIGNPRFGFTINNITLVTPVNSMFGYSIQNYENKEVTVSFKSVRNKLTLVSIN